MTFLLLAILMGACNYPGYSKAPAQLPATHTPTSALGLALDSIQIDPECASGLAPGHWIGSVSINTSASSTGFRIANQTASISLELDISCTGDITGSASRQGSGDIRVPFMLDGTCTENARYQVSGVVLSEDPNGSIMSLTFNPLEGSLSCNLDSSLSSIPSGDQSKDLAGTGFSVEVVPDSLSLTQISGSHWPDTFYQDQFSGTQQVMDEYDIVTQTTASWVFTYQK